MASNAECLETAALRAQIQVLEAQVREDADTLNAIRRGDIDAVMVARSAEDYRLFTLQSADHPYRVLIEQDLEGAVTLAEDGTMLYGNRRLAVMLGIAPEQLLGQLLQDFMSPEDAITFCRNARSAKRSGIRKDITLCTATGEHIAVHLSLSFLRREDDRTLLCGMLTDLTEHRNHIRA